MKTKVINFVSGPSCGKSLCSALIFAELKMRHLSCELVQEYAKQLVWQDRLDELDNQYQVSMEQYKMINAVKNKVEYIVTDSPLLLGLFYNRYHKNNVSNVNKTEEMILNKIKEFDNIYILLERNDEFKFEKEGRIHSEEESKMIDKKMEELLKEFGFKYLKIKSSKDNIENMVKYILE
jgi:hypothetical protein